MPQHTPPDQAGHSLETSPDALRRHLARWPTGVAIVTTVVDGRPIGKTINSFHSTSLQPPLVGWCVDHGSSQLADWLAADGFVVHVVGSDHWDLISRFAARSADRFAGVDWTPGLDGMPRLTAEMPLRLECRVRHRLPAGDHTYLIGQVVDLVAGEAPPLVLQR